ncbi:MAG: hydroxymethylglutaryl-CoA reductase, degradative [bacterium]
MKKRPTSRLSGFYKMSHEERLRTLLEVGAISREDAQTLRDSAMDFDIPNHMIENAIGVFELPLGLGLNFVIDDQEFLVPMAVEEPSVVAAVSHVAKIVRDAGGFESEYDGSTMVGQVQVVGCPDFERAEAAILEARPHLLAKANTFEPGMVARGGGAKDIRVRMIDGGKYQKMLVVHLVIDACDAMGANMINTMVEGIADDIERLSGGKVFLRILSNLCDERIARASCRIPFNLLAWRGFSGEDVAKGIELASQFAEVDPYRATTHNKGIMNGISAVCIASGNDWRALEAGAHAYAARTGQYSPLATWRVEDGSLVGEIEVPIAVGTVGGPIRFHPKVQLVHRLLNVDGAGGLARVMAAVGLAQNMAALKALATEGIQRGHMSLHARSVAATAGATADELDSVVEQLIDCGEIKIDRAAQILGSLRSASF